MAHADPPRFRGMVTRRGCMAAWLRSGALPPRFRRTILSWPSLQYHHQEDHGAVRLRQEATPAHDPEIMSAPGNVRERRGRQSLYVATKPGVLNRLCDVAKIQSTGASNRIENISITDRRLRELVDRKIEPKNRDEREQARDHGRQPHHEPVNRRAHPAETPSRRLHREGGGSKGDALQGDPLGAYPQIARAVRRPITAEHR